MTTQADRPDRTSLCSHLSAWLIPVRTRLRAQTQSSP